MISAQAVLCTLTSNKVVKVTFEGDSDFYKHTVSLLDASGSVLASKLIGNASTKYPSDNKLIVNIANAGKYYVKVHGSGHEQDDYSLSWETAESGLALYETETNKDGNNITAGEVPDLSREGNNDGFSHNEVPTLTGEMLPKLTERFLEQARSDSMTQWARDIFDAYPPGMLHMDSDRGFVLQVLLPNTVRVLQVFEAFECFSSLSMTLESLNAAGIEVELDGFAFITTPPVDDGPAEEAGAMREDAPDASLESMLDLTDGFGIGDPSLGTTASAESRATEVGMWC